MTANSQEIVQQVRDEFEALLTFVVEASPQTVPDADTMERSLLLRLYFVQHNQRLAPQAIPAKQGDPLPLHSQKERSYLSVLGRVRFARGYYYRAGEGRFLLDATLNRPPQGASDLVREWRQKRCVYVPYHQAEQLLQELLPLTVSTRPLQQEIKEDAKQVRDYYAQKNPPDPDPQATLLVTQGDGKGEKSSRKKEALVTSVYTLAPCGRTPEAVLESLFESQKTLQERAQPSHKRVFATLEGKAAALRFTATQANQLESVHIHHRIALTDGCEALQEQVQIQFPDFTRILDCIHALESLWKAANALLGETAPERTAWVKERAHWLLSGQTPTLIADLQAQALTAEVAVGKTLLSVAAYYARNRGFMHYDQYLAAGWPIATGVIEGACRHLVKDRCELSGMRWTQPGAEALLQLRSVAENGDWEAFHVFRRAKRQATLYDKARPSQPQIEWQMAT